MEGQQDTSRRPQLLVPQGKREHETTTAQVLSTEQPASQCSNRSPSALGNGEAVGLYRLMSFYKLTDRKQEIQKWLYLML